MSNTTLLSPIVVTCRVLPQLCAHHTGIQDVPAMITHSVVGVVVAHLHTTKALLSGQCPVGPIEQLDISLHTRWREREIRDVQCKRRETKQTHLLLYYNTRNKHSQHWFLPANPGKQSPHTKLPLVLLQGELIQLSVSSSHSLISAAQYQLTMPVIL